jgi:hypothetical protein
MDCGCGSKRSCECGEPMKGLPGSRASLGSMGTRESMATRSRSVAAPGLPAAGARSRVRAAPIGTRSTVPLPAGFDDALKIRVPRVVMVELLFGEADAIVRAEALRLLRLVPDTRLVIAERLLAETPPAFRLDRLTELVRSDPGLEAIETTVTISPLRTSLRVPRVASRSAGPVVPTCLANDFDPRWGTPPATYHDIPLQFDAGRGWYAFDVQQAHRDAPRDLWGQPKWDSIEFARVASSYDASYALQPYRRSLGSPWDFRWILRVDRGPDCSFAPPTSI